jgi:two-component system sensor histidine kinase SenX3
MDRTDELVAGIHDLKSPLIAIQRLSESLLSDRELSEDAARKLNLIRRSAEEAFASIDDLDLSRTRSDSAADHSPQPPGDRDRGTVDLAALACDVLDGFRGRAAAAGQTVTYRGTDPVDDRCRVAGNARQLREAMKNLLSNAAKYSPPEAAIDVSVRRTDESVRLAVSDEGQGIAESDLERIFEPSVRAAPDAGDADSSTGLGLYLVRRIVERHGGTVEVDSTPGVGSTFVLRLPAADGGDRSEQTKSGEQRLVEA